MPPEMSRFSPYQGPAGAVRAPGQYWAAPSVPMARPERRLLARTCAIVLGVLGVLMLLGAAAFVVGRKDAIASPARSLVQEPCAQYRELSIRAHGGTDEALARQIINWIAANTTTFDQAAALDPDIADAAGAMHALNGVFADPASMARTTRDEIDRMEAPLAHACVWGPGRA